jgi:epoxide hydrolase 4
METEGKTYETEEKIYQVNGISLHCREAGDAGGPVIVLLHGFPEFWYGWQKQIGYFAGRGFRVVVPDQRGYNRSSKPRGVRAYTLQQLTRDIAALIGQLSSRPVVLAGHDWGGAVAWAVATHYPQLLSKLVILNMPHPQVMQQRLRRDPRQMLRSWYAAFFQFPFLPQLFTGAFNFKGLERALVKTARPGSFSAQDLQRYKKAWRQPGALKAMINWYKAYKYNAITWDRPVTTPTLIIWGKKDAFLQHQMAAASLKKCVDARLEMIPHATHWLHHEQPDLVNSLIHRFVGGGVG